MRNGMRRGQLTEAAGTLTKARPLPSFVRLGLTAASLGAAWAVARSVPAVCILPTFLADPPTTLGPWCRWSGPGTRPAVALTFDDGPAADTVGTLELLAELDMRATFFVLGRQIEAHPDLAVHMERQGHEVGIHGFEHRSDLLTAARTTRADLQRVDVDVIADDASNFTADGDFLCSTCLYGDDDDAVPSGSSGNEHDQ